MTAPFILIMVLYSAGMACGQLLFKLAAMSSVKQYATSSLGRYLNPYLLSGVVLYGLLTLLWVWILRSVPLSKAYPFVALSFIFTPILSKVFLNEPLTWAYSGGIFLIAAGLLVIVRG